MANVRTLDKVGNLFKEKKRLEAKLAIVKKDIADRQEDVIEYFVRHNMQSHNANGITLHLVRNVYANHNGDLAATCDALKDAGHGDLVVEKFHSGKLTSTIKEMLATSDEAQELLDPAERLKAINPKLAEHIKVSETVRLSAKV